MQGMEMDHQLAVVELRQTREAMVVTEDEHKRTLAGAQETHLSLHEKLSRAQTQCTALATKMAAMFPVEHVHKLEKQIISISQVSCAVVLQVTCASCLLTICICSSFLSCTIAHVHKFDSHVSCFFPLPCNMCPNACLNLL
jgi:hypothetical protein